MAWPQGLRATTMSVADVVEASVWIAALRPWQLAGATPAAVQAGLLHHKSVAMRMGDEVVAVAAFSLDTPVGAMLYAVAVRPDWQRKGVGSRLFEIVEAEIFQTCAEVHVLAAQQDEQSRSWLVHRGYQQRATMLDYWRPGNVAVIYTRRRRT